MRWVRINYLEFHFVSSVKKVSDIMKIKNSGRTT